MRLILNIFSFLLTALLVPQFAWTQFELPAEVNHSHFFASPPSHSKDQLSAAICQLFSQFPGIPNDLSPDSLYARKENSSNQVPYLQGQGQMSTSLKSYQKALESFQLRSASMPQMAFGSPEGGIQFLNKYSSQQLKAQLAAGMKGVIMAYAICPKAKLDAKKLGEGKDWLHRHQHREEFFLITGYDEQGFIAQSYKSGRELLHISYAYHDMFSLAAMLVWLAESAPTASCMVCPIKIQLKILPEENALGKFIQASIVQAAGPKIELLNYTLLPKHGAPNAPVKALLLANAANNGYPCNLPIAEIEQKFDLMIEIKFEEAPNAWKIKLEGIGWENACLDLLN